MSAMYERLMVSSLFERYCIARFVCCDELLAKLIERTAFDFTARTAHQIQIKMQIMQRDQAKPENLFRLDQVTDVTARKFAAGFARAVLFYRTFVQRELCVF